MSAQAIEIGQKLELKTNVGPVTAIIIAIIDLARNLVAIRAGSFPIKYQLPPAET